MAGSTADIIARLRLNGEDFSRDFRGRMSEIETQARSTGARVGSAFAGIGTSVKSAADSMSVFAEGQRAADRLLASVNPLAAAQQRYNQAMDLANDLQAQGVLTGQRYLQVIDGLNEEFRQNLVLSDRVARGQARGGQIAVQASQQFQDFFIQVGAGQSILSAFAMQTSQLAFVMQGAEGGAGKFAKVISGPWGAAILGGLTLLGLFAGGHRRAADETRAHETAAQTLTRALRGQEDAINKVNEALRENARRAGEAIETEDQRARAAVATSIAYFRQAMAIREALRAQLDTERQRLQESQGFGDPGPYGEQQALQNRAAAEAVEQLTRRIAEQEQRIAEAQQAIVNANIPVQQREVAASMDAAAAATLRYERALERLNARARGMSQGDYRAEARRLQEERDRAIEAAREADRAARQGGGDSTQFRLPVTGAVRGRFGENRGDHSHAGMDIAVPVGTRVGAAAPGTVIEVGTLPGYGNVVIIDHGRGTTTRYAHLSQMLVQRGQRVDQGDAIALSGGARGAPGSGNSRGPHVHFEVRRSGRPVAWAQGRFPTDEMGGQAAAEALAQAAQREEESRVRILGAMREQTEEAVRAVRVTGMQSQDLDRQAALEEGLARVRAEHAQRMAELPEQFRQAQGQVTSGLEDQLRIVDEQVRRYAELRTANFDRTKLSEEQRTAETQALDAVNASLASAAQLNSTMADGLATREAAVRAEQAITAAVEAANEAKEEQGEIDQKLEAAAEQHQRKLEQEQEAHLRRQEDQVRAVADLFETAMTDGVDGLWDEFKSAGIRAIAEIGAAWTLAMMTGQRFDPAQAIGAMGAQGGLGPFGTLFGGLFGGGGLGGGKGSPGFGGGVFGHEGAHLGGMGGLFGGGGKAAGGAGGIMGAIGSAAGPFAMAVMANQLIGDIFGFEGGPLGIFTGLLKTTKRGSATSGFSGGELGVGSTRGNSRNFISAASGAMESIIGSVNRIAEALGGEVTGAGSLSVGQRDGKWRLDRTGSGITKTKRGAVDFGEDQEAVVRAGIAELLRDGVVGGISDASKHILESGQDLEKAIEKAAMIEELPRLLKARLDPVGAALDAHEEKWRKVIAALEEGGATAEQFADAHRLYKLELEEVIDRTESASQGLKDFMEGLKMGPNSPFSLRQQEEMARAKLQPFLDQIAGGESIDQERYQEASQQFLDIERQLYGSRGQFFEAMDTIMAATNKAIERIDGAVPIRTAADPFVERTATNTGTMTQQLDQVGGLLVDIRGLLERQSQGGSDPAFIGGGAGFSTESLLERSA